VDGRIYVERELASADQIQAALAAARRAQAECRKLMIQLRNSGAINDEAMRRIEYELDLEEARLILERSEA
jgi:hypothetical protein